MLLTSLRFGSVRIPFKHTFRHASAGRSEAANIFVSVTDADGCCGIGEGCPRPYVTGETTETAIAYLSRVRVEFCDAIDGLAALQAWLSARRSEIDNNPAAFCALELAVLDLLGRRAGVPVEDLLDLPRPREGLQVTAVFGVSPAPVFMLQLLRYLAKGMRDAKLKLSDDRHFNARRLRVLSLLLGREGRIRVDANNLWSDSGQAIEALRGLPRLFGAVEEPIRAGDIDGMRRISETLEVPIILDESLVKLSTVQALLPGGRWILNLRVSKLGGIHRTVEILRAARMRAIPAIVGCHVGETSVLARAGIAAAAAAHGLLVGFEGGYGTHLLERDVADPSLTFDGRGQITPGVSFDPSAPGLGLQVNLAALSHPASS